MKRFIQRLIERATAAAGMATGGVPILIAITGPGGRGASPSPERLTSSGPS